MSTWPTPLKKLLARFPETDIVQIRFTHKDGGSSLSFEGVPTDAIKAAVFAMIVPTENATDERDAASASNEAATIAERDEEIKAARAVLRALDIHSVRAVLSSDALAKLKNFYRKYGGGTDEQP